MCEEECVGERGVYVRQGGVCVCVRGGGSGSISHRKVCV